MYLPSQQSSEEFEPNSSSQPKIVAGKYRGASVVFNILKETRIGSIGFYMQMFVINILKPYDRAESLENSLSPAKPA